MNDKEEPVSAGALPSVDDALTQAVRLLRNAELETNLVLMERLEGLAASWITVAGFLMDRREE